MLICAIDLILTEDQEPMNSSLITSDKSMAISPNTTINESWTTRKNKSRTHRRGRNLGLSDVSTPIYQNMHEESSLMTSDMSQVTEISERNDSSYSMPKEKFQKNDNMETSTHDKPPACHSGKGLNYHHDQCITIKTQHQTKKIIITTCKQLTQNPANHYDN